MKYNDSFGIDTSKFEQLCYYQFQLKMHSPYMRVYTTQWCVASFSKARSEFLLNASNVNTHPRDEILSTYRTWHSHRGTRVAKANREFGIRNEVCGSKVTLANRLVHSLLILWKPIILKIYMHSTCNGLCKKSKCESANPSKQSPRRCACYTRT